MKEIEAMLQVHDIRESRVYQEALEEGKQEGVREGLAIAIVRMAAKGKSATEIAALLELDADLVRRILAPTQVQRSDGN